ncbi:P-II family nitrogen regulator [Clostridium sp. 19966]|uniref:P-II family nitrogen regulator n=1 Tax=Clostridium sp. 19966 TaxID=2768166 RepID=UPI0028DE2CE9|nr:P-II family nitrogen regulator [Clostridium sp. 19966]MDT8715140.1 P-II family nitrogen regulator [Clostridium sp. 19966]
MKKLEIILRPEKLEDLKQILNELNVKGMSVTTVLGCGNQKGVTERYRGTVVNVNLIHKVKVEVVVVDEIVDTLVTKVREGVSTGHIGDGKIFIYNVENAIRIRTGETGDSAI